MIKDRERAKRSARERATRSNKRKQFLQLIVVIVISIINVKFIISSMKRPRRGALVVSSTFVCDSSGDRDCLVKKWVRQNSFRNWKESGSDVLILEDHIYDCDKMPSEQIECQEHHCMHSSLGLPIVKCLVQTGMDEYPDKVVVFTNDDMLFQGLNTTIDFLVRELGTFVAVGRRTNVPLLDLVDIDDTTIERAEDGSVEQPIDLDDLASRHFQESRPFELDYFIFNIDRSILDNYPEFVLGNWRWDNVMVDYLLLNNITVVDASKSITAFHLGKTSTKQDFRKGAKYNDDLMKQYFENTVDQYAQDESELDPILRFGSMTYAQYQVDKDTKTGALNLVRNEESIFLDSV